jgi:multiple sugar transport system substrate-binding protein
MNIGRRSFLQVLGSATAGMAIAKPAHLWGDEAKIAPVKFWDMHWGYNTYFDAARNLTAEFTKRNPSIPIDYQGYMWTEWPKVFDAAFQSETLPDISTGGGSQAVEFYEKGSILELDDVFAELKSSGEDKDFLHGTLESSMYKGHAISLPWCLDTRILFYRKDLFASNNVKVPSSWEELRAAAKTLTVNNEYGLVVAGNDLDGMHGLFALMINNGGGLFTTEGKLALMNARNVEAMTFLSDLVKDGSVNPGSAHFTSSDAHREFLAGRGAIMMDTPGYPIQFTGPKENLGVLPPPTAPHGDKGTVLMVNNIMLYKHGSNPAAVKTFLKWWSKNGKPLWTKGLCDQLPLRTSIAEDPYFQNNPITKQILDEWVPIGKGIGSRATGTFPALNIVEGDGVMMTLLQDLLSGKDVAKSMHKAEARLTAIL